MSFHSLLWLLFTLSAVAVDISYYTPQLTISPLQGRVTVSTFILDNPQCLFDRTSSNVVWLIVANQTVILSDSDFTKSAPYSSFERLGYYRTLNNIESSYPCNSEPQYIRVGNDYPCTGPDNCNGPLTSPGPYRVKFVVITSASTVMNQTQWSYPITLRQGKMASGIDTWPGGRSGGMIVITSILSILLATFLVCLIGTFIVGRKNLTCCKKNEKIESTIPQALNMKNYKTHHAPENTSIYSEPMA
ncbi:uroplakin-3b [Rhinoderma darwinii]|uniref:uroplakin-3b n=1 Tax=Rhinoderma darwinii TaxID=43563 RepID=UPI003F672AF7